MAVSSIHATSISSVSTFETLYRSPPNALLSSFSAILFDFSSGFPLAIAALTSCIHLANAHTSGLFTAILFAQLVIMRCCPSPLQRSAKPSDVRIKYRGDDEDRLSSRRCVISGCAVIYGGVRLRRRNSSQGEVLWNPGKRLYRIRRVNAGGCLKGMSPKPIMID
jgi:hypothetical protein